VLAFGNYALFVLHSLLIVFNMTGWAWRRTRWLHLITVGVTLFSWFVLGAFYGWGYCVCTDWHFQIRTALGYIDPEVNYLQLLSAKMLGLSISSTFADRIALLALVYILVATAIAWLPRKPKTLNPAE